MPAVTWLNDSEIRAWSSLPDDKDCDELLQELRTRTGENWLIGRVAVQTEHASLWKRLFCKPPEPDTNWTLYADCHGEWQVMSLVAPGGSTIFHGDPNPRETIMNYMLGYIGGYYRGQSKTEAGKESAS